MEEKSKIGEIYRTAFKDFKADPPDLAWQGIEQNLSPGPVNGARFMKPSWFIGTAVLVAVVGVVAYFGIRRSGNTSGTFESNQYPAVQAAVDSSSVRAAEQTPAAGLQSQQSEPSVDKLIVSSGTNDKTEVRKAASATSKESVHAIVREQSPGITVPIRTTQDPKQMMLRPVINGSFLSKPVASKQDKTGHTRLNPTPGGASASTPVAFSPDTTLCKGGSAHLRASGGEAYQWNTGETMDTVMVTPAGTTIYRVTVTLPEGRDTVGSILVKVVTCESVYVPNAFSPNGDGKNDVFLVKGNDILDFSMKILSRSGQVIFETRDLNLGWDGKIKGDMAPTGIYLYQVKYTDASHVSHEKTGQVMLLR